MTDIVSLWQSRQSGSLRESLRYFRDAARGGLLAFLLFLFIICSYFYGKMLQQLPTDFPFWWAALALLLPAAFYGSVRTYLRDPDVAFLLAAETKMAPYFRRSFSYSMTVQGFAMVGLALALWPLYKHCRVGRIEPLGFIWLALLLLKAANLAARWLEDRLRHAGHRLALRLFRLLMTGLAIYAIYVRSIVDALLISLPWIVLSALAFHLLPKVSIAWESLIDAERRMKARRYRVFSWFADVPQLHGEVRRRSFVTSLFARRVAFRQDRSLLYLMTLTWLRSELFGISLRLTLTALALEIALPRGLVTLLIGCLFVLLTAIQLSALSHYHKLSVWPRLYPLPEGLREAAQAQVTKSALLAQTVLLTGTAGALTRNLLLTAGMLVVLIAFSLGYASFRFRRKRPSRPVNR